MSLRDEAARRPAATIALFVLVLFSALAGFEYGQMDDPNVDPLSECFK